VTKGKGSRNGSQKKEDRERSSHLLPNERISFGGDAAKPRASDEELNSRYVKGDVRIVTESARYSLGGILAMLQETVEVEGPGEKKELRYKLDPEYQRRHRWSNERKSRLIESFPMNVPVPPVFLYERDLVRFEVMDGRQRLTALSEFYADKFPLEGLQYWSDLDGRTYSQLPSKVRDGIDRRYISSIILLKETAATEEQAAVLKKIVFERLNSGGVKLTSQETRNAVYNGPLNQLCLTLSENESFRKMWGIPVDPTASPNEESDEDADDTAEVTSDARKGGKRMFEKMEDVELVLRFFAYRHVDLFKSGLNRMADSLDRFLMSGNRFHLEGLAGGGDRPARPPRGRRIGGIQGCSQPAHPDAHRPRGGDPAPDRKRRHQTGDRGRFGPAFVVARLRHAARDQWEGQLRSRLLTAISALCKRTLGGVE